MIKEITKRDGTVVKFEAEKIKNAIRHAFESCEVELYDSDLNQFMKKIKINLRKKEQLKGGILSVEDVQDTTEDTLMHFEEYDVARAFIKYRDAHKRLRAVNDEISDQVKDFATKIVKGSLGKFDLTESADPCKELDVIHNQNASTSGGTIGASILQTSEAISKLYWESLYDDEINEYSQVGSKNYMYIHDMGFVGGYCAGWNLKYLITYGLGGVPNKITSAPPQHLMTVCTQLVNFLGIMQNEWAGAQAVSSFDTYLSPFVKMDNMTYKEVKQCIQIFVYGVNVSSRWGSQSPFSNITLDWVCPDDLKNMKAVCKGKEQDFTYGDCQQEMDMINKAFLEIMIAGDANGRGFQYPIPTYNITKEFDWSDTENNRLLFEMAAKYGIPYFSNYINSDMEPSDVRSMCCRLRLDLRELRKQNGGNFGAGENTGSIGVVTIDLPQLAYISETEEEFFKKLEKTMSVAARSLDVKRKVVEYYYDKDAYPYTKAFLPQGLSNHFSTIGLVGMNEACLNSKWIGKDLTHPESISWANKVLEFMRSKLSDFQETYGNLFNLEATPAESTSYTLARKDKEKYPDIITAGLRKDETPYYTNSSHLPVGSIEDIFDALDKEDDMQTKYTSGTVFHAFLGERLPDWQAAMKLVRTIAENYKLPYFTLSPTYSICTEHGYIKGEHHTCPICGKPTEIYSRITGYYRPVSNWNAGKTQEFKDRETYNLSKSTFPENHTEVNNIDHKDSKLSSNSTIQLLTSHTCPRCKMVKSELDKKGIDVKILYADEPGEGQIIAKEQNIFQVPVLLADGKMYKDFTEILNVIRTIA